jgi:hypothetical protein
VHRKLVALAAASSAALIVLSALAQTPPPKKKHKKKHKPAATAVDAGAPAAIELDTQPAPAGSASAGAAPAAAEEEEDAGASAAAVAASEPEPSGPGGAHPWSVGALVGWGFNGGAKLGFGVRAGYTLPMHVYLGAQFVYHLGESEYGGTANFFYPGVEGGYELSLGPLLVRPYLGIGPMILDKNLGSVTVGTTTNSLGSNSTTYFAVWPGVTGLYPITPQIFVGADLRYVILSDYSHFAAFLTGGARF